MKSRSIIDCAEFLKKIYRMPPYQALPKFKFINPGPLAKSVLEQRYTPPTISKAKQMLNLTPKAIDQRNRKKFVPIHD